MELDRIIEGDALTVLKTMPSKLVQCVVTSPPYWGLRDYGTAEWEGGDPECDHIEPQGGQGIASKKQHTNAGSEDIQYRDNCPKCGAIRIDNQLGLESTPEEYVAKMVEIFAEVRRVLRDDGTLWLNMGDSYAGSDKGAWDRDDIQKEVYVPGVTGGKIKTSTPNLKPKDLCGIPWRVAFALQADGWYLRSDIIWSKPNPMPESVTDRPTKAHEYLFLLTKKAKYYYDADAIRENYSESYITDPRHETGSTDRNMKDGYDNAMAQNPKKLHKMFDRPVGTGRNRRTVWEIATQPYPEAHFATFPEKLVEPCILAGSNDRACRICGAAWEREIKTEYIPHGESAKSGGDYAGDRNSGDLTHGKFRPQEMKYGRATRQDTTLGFRPSCEHDNGDSRSIILDPFMGSGTVALVALKYGRDYIGIELKPEYIAMAMKRLKPLGNKPLAQQEILI